jgi:DNA-binding ferritin-like protein (Dps family)
MNDYTKEYMQIFNERSSFHSAMKKDAAISKRNAAKAKMWMKRTGKSAEEAAKEFDIDPKLVNEENLGATADYEEFDEVIDEANEIIEEMQNAASRLKQIAKDYLSAQKYANLKTYVFDHMHIKKSNPHDQDLYDVVEALERAKDAKFEISGEQ